MPRGKSVAKNLVESAEAAYFAAVEIHNKPMIAYRYATTTLLIINAWELVLKAYIYKNIGRMEMSSKILMGKVSRFLISMVRIFLILR